MNTDLSFFSIEGGEAFIATIESYLNQVESTCKKRGREFSRAKAIGALQEIFLEVCDQGVCANEARGIIATRTSNSPWLGNSFDLFNELQNGCPTAGVILKKLAQKHPAPEEESD